jgi:D-sedoheptulose 7-phosphate isomerase
MSNIEVIEELTRRYPELQNLTGQITEAGNLLIDCFRNGGKVMICGNGGSSSDSDHIAGELMKSFESFRPVSSDIAKRLSDISPDRGNYLAQKLEEGLPAIDLSAHRGLITAICNDIDATLIFAQQLMGYGKENDILLAMSTSGNSRNVVDACITARALKMKVIGMTGMTGGKMKEFCDILINVPEKRTAYVQELHLPVFHAICLIIENHFYPNHK